MAAKKDKMIPSEKERKRALKYATPAGTGRMWVTMGIAFIIFGIWRIEIERKGTAPYQHVICSGDDEDNYSDVFCTESDVIAHEIIR